VDPLLLSSSKARENLWCIYAPVVVILLRTLVNSTSTASLIGLPPKGAEFCHTSNRLLVGRCHHRALLRLYFNSSAVSCWLFVDHWLSVVGWSTIRVNRLWEVSLQKDNFELYIFSMLRCSPSCPGKKMKDEHRTSH
jgi:hypothetical protein